MILSSNYLKPQNNFSGNRYFVHIIVCNDCHNSKCSQNYYYIHFTTKCSLVFIRLFESIDISAKTVTLFEKFVIAKLTKQLKRSSDLTFKQKHIFTNLFKSTYYRLIK